MDNNIKLHKTTIKAFICTNGESALLQARTEEEATNLAIAFLKQQGYVIFKNKPMEILK